MAQQTVTPNTILRRRQVEAESGQPRSTLYWNIAKGTWTRPVKLGARSVGWPAGEVATLNAARIAGKSETEIRTLVAKLHASRGASLVEA
jgi:prophage regulatory protein